MTPFLIGAGVLVLGVVLAVFQQWCGINVIFNYAEEIFRVAGYDISTVLKNIAWTGSVNLVFTLVALGIVDRGGRRPLMLFGSAALAVIYGIMGFCYKGGVQGLPMLLLVLGAIGCYAMSLAPVAWVVISEIFPTSSPSEVMTLVSSSVDAAITSGPGPSPTPLPTMFAPPLAPGPEVVTSTGAMIFS